MKKSHQTTFWIAWVMLAATLPAYANNPPAPDGMLAIILIFPVAILGFRFAGAKLNEKEVKWKIGRRIFLAAATLVTAAGTAIGAIGLLIVSGYGLLRGVQAMWRGRGAKRFATGFAVVFFTLFAGANYMASLNPGPSEEREAMFAIGRLRTIVTAEQQFRSGSVLDADKNGVPEFGTTEHLIQADLTPQYYYSVPKHGGPRVTLVLTGDPAQDEKEFFAYARPTYYGTPRRTISIVDSFRLRVSRLTYATDETGVIRSADVGTSRPVTRAEAEKWSPIE